MSQIDSLLDQLLAQFDVVLLPQNFSYRNTSKNDGIEGVKNDAAVLILLDFEEESGKWRVLLNVRSNVLRRHPGEVCFPGGMRNVEDQTPVETALRESYEVSEAIWTQFKEIGLPPSFVRVVGTLMPMITRHHIRIYPVLGLLNTRDFYAHYSAEVRLHFWAQLNRFLEEDSDHKVINVDESFNVHVFRMMAEEEEVFVFGITAIICVVVAIGTFGKLPEFQMNLFKNMSENNEVKMQLKSLFENFGRKLPFIEPKTLYSTILSKL